ncbi:Calcium-responsive transactivator, partial [Galemys pyrenaicus]
MAPGWACPGQILKAGLRVPGRRAEATRLRVGAATRQPAHAPVCCRQMLDENHHLIQCILDYQSKGKTAECAQYQQILHRNLVYLATIADSNQNMQSLLPAPPTQNMTLGPGALSQSGSGQGLHAQGSLSDAISTGLPPSSLMQGQIGNGPNHVSLQQTAQSTLPTTSMSMSGSGHGSGPGYSHSGPASQSVPLQGQGAMGSYVSRANINMQSNPVSMMHQQAASAHYSSAQGGGQHYQGQSSIAMMAPSGQGGGMMGQRPLAPYRPSQQGSSQQYLGQEEYYSGEQYGHGQAASEPMSQQYYPDGHGEYAYQQPSYTEQSYDRSFEESTQHYYEGGKAGPAAAPPHCRGRRALAASCGVREAGQACGDGGAGGAGPHGVPCIGCSRAPDQGWFLRASAGRAAPPGARAGTGYA